MLVVRDMLIAFVFGLLALPSAYLSVGVGLLVLFVIQPVLSRTRFVPDGGEFAGVVVIVGVGSGLVGGIAIPIWVAGLFYGDTSAKLAAATGASVALAIMAFRWWRRPPSSERGHP